MCDPSAALTPFLYSYPHVKRFVFSTWHALPHSIRGFKCRFDLISLWSPHWHLLMSPSGSLNPTMGGPRRWRSPSCELHHFVYLEQHAALHSCYICVEFPERQRADRPWPQVAHFHTRTLFLFFSFLFFSIFFFPKLSQVNTFRINKRVGVVGGMLSESRKRYTRINIHMDRVSAQREAERRNIPQSTDEAVHRAFRVQRHNVSDVKETRPVLWHVSLVVWFLSHL